MAVTFVSSTYNYTEDHGEVSNIEVQLSNPIAQSLEVFYSGGEIHRNIVVNMSRSDGLCAISTIKML